MTENVTMTPEVAKALRAPFDPDQIGKLPRVTCYDCRNARGKVCDQAQHRKVKCPQCGNYMTTAHLHLDYVGHAEVTARLIAVDPTWSWEPLAFGDDGLPATDRNNGMWIKLTVAGVTRLGYGHADGKTGGDAVKEAIGDALRNAAMRFGVALDLWGATFKAEMEDAHSTPIEPPRLGETARLRPEAVMPDSPPDNAPPAEVASVYPVVSPQLTKRMHALFGELGQTERDVKLKFMAWVVRRQVTTSRELSATEVQAVIDALVEKTKQAAREAS
ncbi:hypothetical protein [Micromonospora sp. NPDC005652]|uniref:hypothetical protein n=1 Tax=Micromonospora sp. NPDC005652 TaxID=3157046 RepID=UPI0033DA6911